MKKPKTLLGLGLWLGSIVRIIYAGNRYRLGTDLVRVVAQLSPHALGRWDVGCVHIAQGYRFFAHNFLNFAFYHVLIEWER